MDYFIVRKWLIFTFFRCIKNANNATVLLSFYVFVSRYIYHIKYSRLKLALIIRLIYDK